MTAVPADARFTAAEREALARIEAAEEAPEALRERVARAIWETVDDWPWDKTSPEGKWYAYRQADAALAVIRPSLAAPESFDPIAALRRVEALADELEQQAEAARWFVTKEHTADWSYAQRIRAALAAPDQGGVR